MSIREIHETQPVDRFDHHETYEKKKSKTSEEVESWEKA